MFCLVLFKQPHQQTHIDFHHTAGTWLCCIIVSSLFQTVTLCHCINIQPIFFGTELFLCVELRSVKDTQKPQLYLQRQLWWQSPLLNVQRIWKYCSSPLSRVALKASISITDSGSESSHYTQFTENMQLDIFPSDSQTVGHTVQLLPLLDCSLNLYTLSDEMNLTWSICSLYKIFCIMWTVVSAIISVHCSVQNTMYELAEALIAGAYYKTSISCLACSASKSTHTAVIWRLDVCQLSFPCNYFMNSIMCWLFTPLKER